MDIGETGLVSTMDSIRLAYNLHRRCDWLGTLWDDITCDTGLNGQNAVIASTRVETRTETTQPRTYRSEIRRGFFAMLPFWPGTIPFAVTFAVLARTSGYSALETQLMSMLVFAGSAQLAMVTLFAGGATAVTIVVTAVILNLRHVIYGLSIDRQTAQDEPPRRSFLAFFLTDESYGVATREWLAGRGSAAFLLGTGFSLYSAFTTATLAGILFGSLLPDVEDSGIDFIFPLSFLALLLPLLRSRLHVGVAAMAGVIALVAGQFFSAGIAILLATIAAALAGMALERREESA
jgi:4-azaleucine resistance transporter AzlC